MSGQGNQGRGEQQPMYHVPPPYQLATAAQLAGTSYGAVNYAGARLGELKATETVEIFGLTSRSARGACAPCSRGTHSPLPAPTALDHKGMAGPPGAPMLIPYGIPGAFLEFSCIILSRRPR